MADTTFIIKQKLKMLMQSVVLPVVYKIGCIRRVDDRKIVFADAHHDERPVSMDRLVNTLRIETDDKIIIERYKNYAACSLIAQLFDAIGFMWLYATAGCVVICDNFLPVAACNKRRKTTVIQLWHGPGAFKKFGYDTDDDIPSFYKGNVFRNYDLVSVSGEKCVKPYISAMRQPEGVVKAIGVSRMDDYHSAEYIKSCKNDFYRAYPAAKGKKVLLWAPTFRGNAANARLVGLNAMDRLKAIIGDDWLVIYSVHPHLFNKYERDDIRGRIPTERMIPAVDVFITDYSSVLYDACVFNKKICFFVPDIEEFRNDRGTYTDIEELPGELITNEARLFEAVLRAYNAYDFDKQARFIADYLSACDGFATKRIIEYMRRHI